MPPEITAALGSTAGLMALAAAPPGAASSAGLLLPEPLSASLFAAFLAQSGTPAPKADVPKTNVTLAPNTNASQTPLNQQLPLEKLALPKLKTMDTLPTLSFPPAPKAKVKASELLLYQIPVQSILAPPAALVPPAALAHSVLSEVKPAPETLAALSGVALPIMPLPVVALPVMGQAFVKPPTLLPVSRLQLPAGFVTKLAAPAPVLSSVTPSGAVLSIQPAPTQMDSLAAQPPRSSNSLTFPAPVGVSQTEAVAAPLLTLAQASPILVSPVAMQVPPSLTVDSAAATKAPEPLAPSTVKSKPMAALSPNALPRVASPIPAAPQAQAAPQSQASAPNAGFQEALPLPPVVIAAAQQGAPSPEAGGPNLALPRPASAKITGTLRATLKPSGKNADTSTRTPQGQAQGVTPKVVTPAAAPEPLLMPEKHAAGQEPSEIAESGTNSGMTALPLGLAASVVKPETKPLTAGERAEVVRQAADGIRAMPTPMKPGEAQQMSVQLHPKDWGSLQVSVTVAPSQEAGAAKTVTAHIVAETPQVKAALQSQNGALHQALRASGLHLEHLTVSVKTTDAKIPEVKPAAQSASAGFSSGQGQSEKSGQSYGQPNTDANGFGSNSGTTGFGAGGSQSNRQNHPQGFMAATTDAEPDDVLSAGLPLRPAIGRIDTHA